MPEINSIEDLQQDDENCNANVEPRAQAIIEQSIQRNGAGRSILVDKNGKTIAGNKTLEVAQNLGLDIEVVHTNGQRLVVVVRDDLDLDHDSQARELSIADNRAAEVGLNWRMQKIEEMRLRHANLKTDYLFTAAELKKKLARAGDEMAAKKPVTCPHCGGEFTP